MNSRERLQAVIQGSEDHYALIVVERYPRILLFLKLEREEVRVLELKSNS